MLLSTVKSEADFIDSDRPLSNVLSQHARSWHRNLPIDDQ